jgi:hypothetical protein
MLLYTGLPDMCIERVKGHFDFSFVSFITISDNVLVEIVIVDQNDNDPVFSAKNYSADIFENTPQGTSIITVSAKDKDESSTLRFSIDSGDDANVFEMKSDVGKVEEEGGLQYKKNTGSIFVVQKLDFDTPPKVCSLVEFVNPFSAEGYVSPCAEAFLVKNRCKGINAVKSLFFMLQ